MRARRVTGRQSCAKHRELGLTDAEYELIVEKLGREPNDVELAMFSLLWSEHCAYKHSRKLLRRLPTEGERVVMGPGENAGAVDIGDGHAVAFKVESHNHPSAVEPFQGAATGVGGILRDVFALGARPIAILDSLRFGELDSERSRYLLDGAVRGIGHYGNSIGVPTVGGEIYFEAPYEHNCLVNAMCVGLAQTGGDGARGRRRGRQRGRPDGRLDRPRRDRRRLGAGLGRARRGRRGEAADACRSATPSRSRSCSSAASSCSARGCWSRCRTSAPPASPPRPREMASAGGVGIDIDVAPGAAARGRHGALRDHGLRVAGADARRGRAGEGRRGAGRLREMADRRRGDRRRSPTAAWSGCCAAARSVGEMPVEALVDGCPLYDLEPGRARGLDLRQRGRAGDGRASAGRRPPRGPRCSALLASPSIASKRWAFEQYDSVVGSRTVRRPESADAAVLQIPEAGNAIAVSIDGNGRRVACDPYPGTVEAVLECAQNLACVGAEPLGLTNCLNFGNPEKPAPAWQLDRAVSGLADACEALGVPVVGGNVSLYNEGPEGPIYPTPVVGMVGELPDPARAAGSAFAREGDAIALVGPFAPSLAGSELAKLRGELGARPAAARRRRGRRRLRGGPRRGPRRQRSPPPTTSATAASPARSPRRRSAAGSAAASTSTPASSAAARRRRRCSARGPAASCVSGERGRLEALRRSEAARASSLGEVGGDRDRDRRRRPRARGRASPTPSAPGARCGERLG